MSNDGMWAEENRGLRLENERLRERIEEWRTFEAVLRRRLGARDHETSLDLIARVQRRIEELEAQNDPSLHGG